MSSQSQRAFGSQQNKSEEKGLVDNQRSPKMEINLTFFEESSKYDGEPLVGNYTRPIELQKRIFKDKKEWNRVQRWSNKLGFIATNSFIYGTDIVFWRTDAIAYKTAEFVKRNTSRIWNTLAHIWLELKHVAHGFRDLKNDVKYAIGFNYGQTQIKYAKDKPLDKAKLIQIKTDVIKFVPFSFFILIPGAEILLPPFLVVFPNSVPSQFMSNDAREAKFKLISERREKAAIFLNQAIPQRIAALERDEDILQEDLEQILELKGLIKKGQVLPTDLLQFKEVFRRYGEFKYMEISKLLKVAHFLGIEPVTGVNIINNILKIVKLGIPVDSPVIRDIAKLLVVRELNMYFSRIRKFDIEYSFKDLEKLSDEDLDNICFRRGIEINNQTRKDKIKDFKLWLSISNQRNVPHSLLLYTRVNDYTNHLFEIDESEDDQEVLRRDHDNTYYLEKMRVFEETFGIDKLLKLVSKMGTKLQDIDKYDPVNNQFLLNNTDLEKMMHAVDDFKQRHSTITDSIQQTYMIGNLMLKYLQQQIIIDSYLSGNQSQLFEQYPDLIKVAKKLLGEQAYNDLSTYQAEVRISTQDQYFHLLVAKQLKNSQHIQKDLSTHRSSRGANKDLPKQVVKDEAESTELPEESEKKEPKSSK